MNASIGFTQLLQMETDPKLTEQQLDNTQEIIKAGQHLLKLINEVLDLSKIESGHIDLAIESVNVGIVIGECLRLVTPLAKKQNIKITTESNGIKLSLEEVIDRESIVRADRIRLKQILLNLLSNAVKYNNANGTITLSCDKVAGNRLRINVTDTGPGISPEDQQHLFQAFNRFGTEQKEIEGTGIGLVITKNIVELMKGSIGVESRVNEGSTFWFELPRDLGNDNTKNIPVIAISANAIPNDEEKGMAAGFSHYITKPIDVSAFMTAIDSAFEISADKTSDTA